MSTNTAVSGGFGQFTGGVLQNERRIPDGKGVTFHRPDLRAMIPSYDLVDDCLKGAEAIKAKGDKYLPRPDASNGDPENLARYATYVERAVFYNVTQRTALGLQGQIFLRPPIQKYPPALESVMTDSNGAGISVLQLARDAEWIVSSNGRAGLFIDYPPQEEGKVATRADLESGNIRPTMAVYGPKNIINWRTRKQGSKQILNLVVLVEEYIDESDPFETKTGIQFRELRLSDKDEYTVQVYRAATVDSSDYVPYGEQYKPKGGDGKPLTEIPFTFIGSKNNEPSIDPPPLLDMAHINIAHYRNSADYEEMIFLVGQPTLTISGLTQSWFDTNLKGRIGFGSRAGIPLPEKGKAELLQVAENTAAFEGMAHKERQMVALGAKIVEQKSVQRTATEAGNETASEESTLSAIAKNVSAAFKWGLEWCAYFANVSEDDIQFELNSDFELARLTPEQVQNIIKSWSDGAISWKEMRTVLRKAGVATLPDDEAKKEIEGDTLKAIEEAALEIGKTTKAQVDANPAESAA